MPRAIKAKTNAVAQASMESSVRPCLAWQAEADAAECPRTASSTRNSTGVDDDKTTKSLLKTRAQDHDPHAKEARTLRLDGVRSFFVKPRLHLPLFRA